MVDLILDQAARVASRVKWHFTGLFVPHSVIGKVDDTVAQFGAGAVLGPGCFLSHRSRRLWACGRRCGRWATRERCPRAAPVRAAHRPHVHSLEPGAVKRGAPLLARRGLSSQAFPH